MSDLIAAALDLGSSQIKAGLIDRDGQLAVFLTAPAPPSRQEGPQCTADPDAYLDIAADLLDQLDPPDRLPLGISVQRSSFLLWERASGAPLTPLISWRDLRAAARTEARRGLEPGVWRRTGLPLSPHYAGPKLAWMLENDPGLRKRAEAGEALFGTLDCWLMWRWTGGRIHAMGPSLAARTLMADLKTLDWSPFLLRMFRVPRACLPEIAPNHGFWETDRGPVIRALTADQTTAALLQARQFPDCGLLNLGTGTFALRPHHRKAPRNCLTAWADEGQHGGARFFWEAPINAGSDLFDEAVSFEWPIADMPPNAFALPEAHGLATPYWRPDVARVFSKQAQTLAPCDKKRLLLEGYVFRIRQAIDALYPKAPPSALIVSGGLAQRRPLLDALNETLPVSVRLSKTPELGLLGAAWQALGQAASPNLALEALPERTPSAKSESRLRDWQCWLEGILARPPSK